MDPETTFAISTAPKRNSLHWQVTTTTWGELQDMAAAPAKRKECGNYLLGELERTTVTHPGEDTPCTDFHRRKVAVVSRSAITLDADHPEPGFAEGLEMTFPNALVLHTTWRSTPAEPRYRLIIPLSRDVFPDEYVAAAAALMDRLGQDNFDPSSDQAERYMFKPSASDPDDYQVVTLDGDPVDVEDLLADFEPDLADKPLPAPHKNKRDPFEIEGTVGLFNTAYEDWDLLIEEFDLPYDKVSEDRYHLAGAKSMAGMGPVAGATGFVYSHHANDPAFGRTCSAFDLVRLHWFGYLDEDSKPSTPVNKLPSHTAMLDVANRDLRVVKARERDGAIDFADPIDDLSDLLDDDNAWRIGLDTEQRTGRLKDTVSNWDLLVTHDRAFRVLRYNELTMTPEATVDLPWRKVTEATRTITTTDRGEMVDYLERAYLMKVASEKVSRKVDQVAARNPYNPVKDYLRGLTWDGERRVETCLPGVRPTKQTRLIARKVMVAAVARMFDPGCKWDHTLVLYGTEGLGKSWWIDQMARGHSSSLGPIDQKDTLLIMQRSWIVVSDEGHALRKADHEAQKEFLTRTSDVFRMPYEKETLLHPRHCVIWSTTNDETFLRRQEGNRRFLIVHCEDRVDFDAVTPEYVDQVWAEAVHMYLNGEEPLYLDPEESVELVAEREKYVEEDALGGLIWEYLEQRVPDNWWDLGIEGRRQWMSDRDDGFVEPGTASIDRVCSAQVWAEVLGRPLGLKRRSDLLDITEALKRLPGWTRAEGRHRLPGYGPQVIFERTGDDDLI